MVQQVDNAKEVNISPAAKLWEMVSSNWVSQALYVAAELNIADLLANGALTSSQLASSTGAYEPYLRRLLRALASLGILGEIESGSFELTELGAHLRSDHPASLRSWVLYSGRQLWSVWGHLLESVKTGKSWQELEYGTTGFGHLDRHQELADVFNQGMVELTRIVSDTVASSYDFSGFERIMDVGGGYGQLLATLLLAYPGLSGVLFDLPRVFEAGKRNIAELGLSDRCEVMSGSFFEAVPSGCDAYILKSIIHDWPDELSQKILANCRTAMPDSGKLLIIDRVYPDRIQVSREHQMIARGDLNMMLGPGGMERTESELRALLERSGFQISQFIPLDIAFRLIEATPAR